MTQLDILATGSAFDAIKHIDERGDYWLARELQPLMGYERWEAFAEAIQRASIAARNSGVDPEQAFSPRHEKGTGGRPRNDFRLARYAAYLTALNGDPRKREVAAAQTYFAVRTHEAEVAERHQFAVPQSFAEALQLAADQAREIEQQRTRLEIAEPKAEYVDGFVNADDASLVRVFAAQLGVGEKALRRWMQDRKLIYRRTVGQRWSNSKQTLVSEYEWLAYAGYRPWFKPVDQPNAPRLHNGQTATTLYVTPVGKVGIRRLLMKHPIEPEAA